MHSRLLVSGLPRSQPPLPPLPAPPCLPCVEGQQRTAPHSSSFPPTTGPLQTLHMDVWGPVRVRGQGRERYFLLVVDDYTRYTTVFPLGSKGEVPDVLIPWIRAVRLQLRERFRQELPVLHLYPDRGGEFSSDLLRDFCRGEGILQLFTLPDFPQQNGIAERRICLVMEVACTSMIHVAAPHFLRSFAVRYAAHQLNLWPRVSLPETLSTLRWTGEVGDASVFRDVTFDESVPFYHLFLYRSAPPLPPPLFLAPSPPAIDPLPPQGPAPSGVSQVDPLLGTVPVEVAGDSGAARVAASGGAASGGDEPGGAEPGSAESDCARSGGAEPRGVEPGGAKPEGVEPEGAESEGAESRGAEPRDIAFAGAGDPAAGDTGAEGAGDTAGPGGTGGAAAAEAHVTKGLALELVLKLQHHLLHKGCTNSVGGAGAREAAAGDPVEPGGSGAGGAGVGGAGFGDTGAVGGGAGGTSAGGAGAGGAVFGERREPESRPASPDRVVRTGRRDPCPRPPPVPSTHAMALRPASLPLRVPLTPPPASSLPAVPHPESNLARAASPTASRLLATVLTHPSFESAAASALVAELVDFAAACRLDYATALVAKSESASPPSVGGECALGTDVLEERQEDFEHLAAAVPRFASTLLAPEGDPDAPDIPTLRSYAEAITSPYSSRLQTAMDAEMAS
ncbi:unnamed protein product [Closterium sp. NIES-54]